MLLADCLSIDEIEDYNKFQGANNYIDPLKQILCVRFNNAPLMGDYWIAKNERETSDIEDFASSPFRSAMEGVREVTATADTTYYQIGS